MRYLLNLAYNGKNYHGWQKQPNALSVQEELEKKISILLRQEIEIVGCGRTDTGVHASQYYAHFDFQNEIEPDDFIYRLNALLPKDIVVYKLIHVQDNFHARFDAISREYEYWISTVPDPFYYELNYLQTLPLNIEAMNEAAALLYSHTDFECFSKVHTDVKTFNCRITKAIWEQRDKHKLVFTICADRFLRNMVRAIVGTLLDVGRGKSTLADVKKILESKNRSEAGTSVPAHGLFLTKIIYPFSDKPG